MDQLWAEKEAREEREAKQRAHLELLRLEKNNMEEKMQSTKEVCCRCNSTKKIGYRKFAREQDEHPLVFWYFDSMLARDVGFLLSLFCVELGCNV